MFDNKVLKVVIPILIGLICGAATYLGMLILMAFLEIFISKEVLDEMEDVIGLSCFAIFLFSRFVKKVIKRRWKKPDIKDTFISGF